MKKGILAALALSLALPTCALGEAGYTAGTYSAEAQGMESAVKVTVTVSDSAITDLTIDVSGDRRAGHGSRRAAQGRHSGSAERGCGRRSGRDGVQHRRQDRRQGLSG